jgi:hypothetical protein
MKTRLAFALFYERIVYGEFLVRSRANIGDLILENVPEMCKFLTNDGAGENSKSYQRIGNGQN